MMGKVRTVTGWEEPAALGITDAHNHLWIQAVPGNAPGSPVLDAADLILQELHDFRAAGGGAQVDCQPPGCGRDARRLRQFAEASGVRVIASTGFHLSQYYPPGTALWQLNADQAADFFRAEINQGLEETRSTQDVVYPGVIKIAVRETLQASPATLLRAAAQVCLESGLAITMHTEKGAGVEIFLDFFTRQGVPPQRLIFCHVDKRPDAGLHAELAQAGVLLEYDTFFRPKYLPDQNVWPLLMELVERGLGGSLALATDMADGAMWARIGGGPGLVGLIDTIQRRLLDSDLNPELVFGLVGGNITARLAIP
jgi:5-phospho-D-xylono-1,4-lactonase